MLLTEQQPDPLTWPSLAARAPSYLPRLDDDARDWLRLALRHSAHGMDLRIGGAMEAEDGALRAFWAAGWLRPLAFAPDRSQRAWALVGCTREVSAAKAALIVESHKGLSPSAYWWGPGERAAEGLALLPAARGIVPGDRVRYAPEFLRSIGMTGDRDMSAWGGVVLRVRTHASLKLADVDVGYPETCAACHWRENGVDRWDPGCDRCRGTGTAEFARVNARNLRRVPAR